MDRICSRVTVSVFSGEGWGGVGEDGEDEWVSVVRVGGEGEERGCGGVLGEDNLEIDSFGFFPFCLMLLLLPPFALPFKCLYRWQ